VPARRTISATDLGPNHPAAEIADAVSLGKAERFNRTLKAEWIYRQASTSNTEPTRALDPWRNYYGINVSTRASERPRSTACPPTWWLRTTRCETGLRPLAHTQILPAEGSSARQALPAGAC